MEKIRKLKNRSKMAEGWCEGDGEWGKGIKDAGHVSG